MTEPLTRFVELEVGGMTCASCAARIEKKLNRLDGVTATVNYATERAAVTFPETVEPQTLIDTVVATGYDARLPAVAEEGPDADDDHDNDHAAGLRRRLIISAVSAVPVIALAMVPPLQFPGWQWLSLMLAWPVVTYGAWPFHRAAAVNARHAAATMDTLISLGVIASFGWSLVSLFAGSAGMIGMRHRFEFVLQRGDPMAQIYLEAAVGVTTFLLAGRYLEARAKRRAGAALRALLRLGAKDVTVVRDHGGRRVEERVPVEQLHVGDEFVVRPGETIATDGTVVTGQAAIDTAMITGEPAPVGAGPGDQVVGGTVNTDGLLTVRATRVGADTQLARIAARVEQAQNGKAKAQRLADRISGVFVPVVIGIAVITAAVWLLAGAGAAFALAAAVAVLIIACPCALGLATPTALMVGTGRGAQLGILLRGPQVLESTRTVDTVVLDKTGTLTTGVMALREVVPAAGEDADTVLALAAAAESGSEHPIAGAIVRHAREAGTELPAPASFGNVPGQGVRADVAERTVVVGRLGFVQQVCPNDGAVDGALQAAITRAGETGRTVIAVAWDGRLRGALVVSDTLADHAPEAVAALRRLGLTPVLLTGDSTAAATQVADALDIPEVHAEVTPLDKQQVIADLQQAGRRVAMVGDGVNDAAALAQADLGIAMGTGTDAAIEAGDLTLVRGDLRAAADAIRLARATLRTIRGNLFWAFAYNVAAIPLAALGLLNPMFAGAAMALSSVFVVTNSLRLRRFR